MFDCQARTRGVEPRFAGLEAAFLAIRRCPYVLLCSHHTTCVLPCQVAFFLLRLASYHEIICLSSRGTGGRTLANGFGDHCASVTLYPYEILVQKTRLLLQ
jgi:hypothetical protein